MDASAFSPVLCRFVPRSASVILDVSRGDGGLAGLLKADQSSRIIYGIRKDAQAAEKAGKTLDEVFCIDIETEDPPLKRGSVDCIVYADVLEHLHDPEQVLRRHRQFLRPGGMIQCLIPNAQHHSVVAALVKSDFQYTDGGLLDRTHLRFFTYSTVIKMLLDAGFAPNLIHTIENPASAAFAEATRPLYEHLGLDARRTARYLDAYQYVFQGVTYGADQPEQESSAPPISFVVCVSNDATLQANLLRSPCLRACSCHEVILVRDFKTAAAGLNVAISRAKHPIVLCVHQDVYLPRGWPERFWEQYRLAERKFAPIGVAGVYGVVRAGSTFQRAGTVVDRDRLLAHATELPAEAETLDELLLVVPKDTPCSFDPAMGFDFYGADLCQSVHDRGRRAVVLDALCFHNSASVNVAPAFFHSAQVFADKWASRLPIATPCILIDKEGQLVRFDTQS